MIDATEKDQKAVKIIMQKYMGRCEIWTFGSKVRGIVKVYFIWIWFL
jgi:hypothetical protein